MPSEDSKQRRRRWPRRLFIAAAVTFVAYVAFGFLGVPLIARHVVVPRIGDKLNGTAALAGAAFNPFTFVIRLDDLTLADEAGEPVVGFKQFEGDLALWRTAFTSGYHFGSALLAGPSLRAQIDSEGTLNVATLIAPMLEGRRETTYTIPRLAVGDLQVTDGRAEFRDLSLVEPFELTVEGLHFAVPGLDTQHEHDNVHTFTASTASGAKFTWEGVVRVDPLTSHGTITITDLPLPQSTPYVHAVTDGRILSGRLAAEIEYNFAPAADPRVAQVRVGSARIDELAVVRGDDKPLLEATEMVLGDARVDANSRKITVASISTTGTRVHLLREASGRFAVQDMVRTDGRTGAGAAITVAEAAGRTAQAEAVSLQGPIRIAIDATRRLLEETRLPWTLQIEQMTVNDYAAEIVDLTYAPPIEVTLTTNQVHATTWAMMTGDRKVAIDTVTVVAPAMHATVPLLPAEADDPDAAGAEPAPASEAGEQIPAVGAPYVVSLASLRIEAGSLVVRDERSDPPARLDLDALQLEATGISTAGGAVPFTLASNLQGSGRLEVSGNLDPFRQQPSASIDLEMSGVPLTPFDPLAGPYVGHGINSGRMAVTFPVTLADNQVKGDLHFTFDGLHLGRKVKSDHASNAPIKLGLDLLRDSNDRIEGTLPIKGDVTDPDFSMGGLVLDAFVGLLGNIALAPFNLLGSLFGGGDDVDISRVEFEPGSAVLSGDALVGLDVLARALIERPALTLDVTGYYNTERDEPVLREILLEKRILAGIQERTTLIQSINAEAYASWVRRFYSAEIGPVHDGDAALTVEQMAAALRAALVVTDKEKASLARERAETAIDILVRENGVPADRVGITAARGDAVLADSPRVEFALK